MHRTYVGGGRGDHSAMHTAHWGEHTCSQPNQPNNHRYPISPGSTTHPSRTSKQSTPQMQNYGFPQNVSRFALQSRNAELQISGKCYRFRLHSPSTALHILATCQQIPSTMTRRTNYRFLEGASRSQRNALIQRL